MKSSPHTDVLSKKFNQSSKKSTPLSPRVKAADDPTVAQANSTAVLLAPHLVAHSPAPQELVLVQHSVAKPNSLAAKVPSNNPASPLVAQLAALPSVIKLFRLHLG